MVMRKYIFKPLVILGLLLSLNSCSKEEKIYSFSISSFISQTGDKVKIVDDEFISPFNTSTQCNIYYYDNDFTDEQLKEIESEVKNDFEYIHALADCKYSYQYNNKDIINMKYLNDVSNQGKEIIVDDILFDMLQFGFSFTTNSEGLFNIFSGDLITLYDDQFNNLNQYQSEYDKTLTNNTSLKFSTFKNKDKINEIKSKIPTAFEDIQDLLLLSSSNNSVKYLKYNDNYLNVSLDGFAKGYATEYVANKLKSEYPNLSMIINSGTSSIKSIGKRPDNKAWNVRYINPLYEEKEDLNNNFNDYEIIISISDEFNISTSGYYERYFYNLEDNEMKLYSHIFNPSSLSSTNYFDQVSVFLNNSALADLYSTTLFSTSSVSEAVSLFNLLNKRYNQDDASLILVTKERDGLYYEYKLSDFDLEKKENNTSLLNSINEHYYVSSSLYEKTTKIKNSKLKHKNKSIISELKL